MRRPPTRFPHHQGGNAPPKLELIPHRDTALRCGWALGPKPYRTPNVHSDVARGGRLAS